MERVQQWKGSYMKDTDVQRTWRKFGWTPPTEYRCDYEFAKNRGTK